MFLGGVVSFIILSRRGNPELKIPWVIVLILFPIFGLLIYLLNVRKKEKLKYQSTKVKAKHYMSQDFSKIKDIEEENLMIAGQAKYIVNSAHFHIYGNTRAKYYPIGEEMFVDIIAELKKARKFIFIQSFIIAEGYMWDSILEILKEKVVEGLEVRVSYDDVGCIWSLSNNYYQQLQEVGIKCVVFNRLKPNLSIIYNNRDHRKMIVIDGNVAFTGGINIADEYINRKERFGHWKDNGIKLEGEAVQNLTSIFLNTWNMLTGEEDDLNNYMPTIEVKETDGYFAPFDDNPLDLEPVGETVYINMINSASEYVYITSPYLLLSYSLLSALSNAAKRGVDVKIITPGIPDKWIIHAITQSFYTNLIEAGVKIYEYEKGFIHSKMFLCDDVVGVVGTINLDYRSLHYNYENAVWIYNSSILRDMKIDLIDTKSKSRLMTIEEYKNTPWYKRIIGAFLKIFAPLI